MNCVGKDLPTDAAVAAEASVPCGGNKLNRSGPVIIYETCTTQN